MKTVNARAQKGSESLHLLAKLQPQDYEIVVFCHLRWEFVYQRPQHIITRLSRHYKILLIEEPLEFEEAERDSANLLTINDNLHLLQARTSSIEGIATLLEKYIHNAHVKIAWFYSPAFLPLLDFFSADTVVYDCMDELTLFRGAPAALALQEQQLLEHADIVFTGGKSLYESKSLRHPNVHCFPSSVDQQHFARALDTLEIPDDIAAIGYPIAGYFGVIDERIDYPLLEEVARQNPHISFVMVGPFAKVNADELPRLPNIHYLGMKPYALLPNYLRAFAVAIMPFALNDATRYISPTKTLEYMSAGKPVISTAIKDVVRDYSGCISIISSAAEFTNALAAALQQAPGYRMPAYQKILDSTSWDATVQKMQSLISLGAVHGSI